MNFGVFVGIGFIGWLLVVFVAIILVIAALWVFFATPVGLVIIVGLIVYGLYRIVRV